MGKRLVIDLELCQQCGDCGLQCGYFYRAQPTDSGVPGLRERATFMLICRRCEAPSCVEACTFDALERRPDGVLERHGLRCVSCGLCVQACPFGTIRPDMVAFYLAPCDYCLNHGASVPPCVASCVHGAIEFREVDPDEPDTHILDAHLAARAQAWVKHEEKTP